jgi:thioredoxin 1
MAEKHVMQVDDDSFEQEVLGAALPVLVDFVAPWCGPCKALEPVVERVAKRTEGRAKVVKVDMDAAPVTARRYGIRGVPTILVFRKGERTGAHLGSTTEEKLMALIEG